ncbi:unnamed protein product [Dovyalis caffra]|uniref:Uncharacterized protein n=1 Tax=Dovyalis caffra TaxID=77055 RepID=A0AAV1SGA4_9ROSI|nr:unnamed protein product [Dovyalis caffra]
MYRANGLNAISLYVDYNLETPSLEPIRDGFIGENNDVAPSNLVEQAIVGVGDGNVDASNGALVVENVPRFVKKVEIGNNNMDGLRGNKDDGNNEADDGDHEEDDNEFDEKILKGLLMSPLMMKTCLAYLLMMLKGHM